MSEPIYRVIKLTKKQHWLLWQMKDVCDECMYNSLDEDARQDYEKIADQICHWDDGTPSMEGDPRA